MIRRAPGYQSSTPKMELHAASLWYRRTTVEGSVAGPCNPMFITLSSRSTKNALKSGSFFVIIYLDNGSTVDSFASTTVTNIGDVPAYPENEGPVWRGRNSHFAEGSQLFIAKTFVLSLSLSLCR
jgi:hypothetical protein